MVVNNYELPEVKDGETFSIAGMEFIKFPETCEGIPVVMKDIACRSRFGGNNDFKNSRILKYLQEEVLPKIIEAIGEENVCEFTTDLTSWDGLKDYGQVRSRISLPTMDFYRNNVDIFDRHKLAAWWWLATAYSAPSHDDAWWILCVSPAGRINGGIFSNDDGGVRPFLILNPSIFRS